MSKIELVDKYKPLFTTADRYVIATGGRGSSKSFSITTYLVLLSMEENHVILFTRYSMTSAHISIIPEFLEKIELLGLSDYFTVNKTEIINNISGSKILFRGIKSSSGDQTANLKSLQGVTIWVMDEAEELRDENVFDKINLSVRSLANPNKVILILNPATKEHWIYRRFFLEEQVLEGSNISQNNTTYIHTTYLDNKDNLSPSFVADVEKMKRRDYEKYKHQILGGWLNKAEGVIYTNWVKGKVPKDAKYLGAGLDWGFSNDPTAIVKVYRYDGKIYLKEFLYEKGLLNSQIAQKIKNDAEAMSGVIVCDSAEPKSIAELRAYMLPVVPIRNKSIKGGINIVKEYDLVIDGVNIEVELNNYVWKKDRDGNPLEVPVDMYNHILDAVRYFFVEQLSQANNGNYAVY